MTDSKKHLASGSTCPPLKEDQLRLYGMRFCPFVQRAKLVLAAKQIPYEEIFINLRDEPEWYLKKNPLGEVPLLEWTDSKTHETHSIPESLIVCDYLDELNSNHRLHPSDPYIKAQQRVLTQRFGDVISAFYQIARQQDVKKGIEELNELLATYEKALKEKFFGGSSPSMMDYMLWPWFQRFPLLSERGFVFSDQTKFPKLIEWAEAMKSDKIVQQVDVPLPSLKRFYDDYYHGVSNYDFE